MISLVLEKQLHHWAVWHNSIFYICETRKSEKPYYLYYNKVLQSLFFLIGEIMWASSLLRILRNILHNKLWIYCTIFYYSSTIVHIVTHSHKLNHMIIRLQACCTYILGLRSALVSPIDGCIHKLSDHWSQNIWSSKIQTQMEYLPQLDCQISFIHTNLLNF